VKVNPDTPQKSVRMAVLRRGKALLVPQPRLRSGFFSRILPGAIPPRDYDFATSAAGIRVLAEPIGLEDECKVDLIVVGSVAVDPETGARVGKGEGFAELEYGMLRLLGAVDAATPIVTCVHDCQVRAGALPPPGAALMRHDVPVDIVVTPTRVYRVDPERRAPKPTGIYWDLLSQEKLLQVPVLRELRQRVEAQMGQPLVLAMDGELLPPPAQRRRGGPACRSSGAR